jgi:hypothetical protein
MCVKSDGSTGLLLTSDYLSLDFIFAFTAYTVMHFRLTDLCRTRYTKGRKDHADRMGKDMMLRLCEQNV